MNVKSNDVIYVRYNKISTEPSSYKGFSKLKVLQQVWKWALFHSFCMVQFLHFLSVTFVRYFENLNNLFEYILFQWIVFGQAGQIGMCVLKHVAMV